MEYEKFSTDGKLGDDSALTIIQFGDALITLDNTLLQLLSLILVRSKGYNRNQQSHKRADQVFSCDKQLKK